MLAEQYQSVLKAIKPTVSEAVFERLNESIRRQEELLERLQRENKLLRELRRLDRRVALVVAGESKRRISIIIEAPCRRVVPGPC
jgi:phosphoenolpyruvate carboxylase